MRLILLLVMLGAHWAGAQSGYQSGFLLTASLDTVHGSIRFPGKSTIPMPCLYRTDKKAAPKEIFPGTVHGFCTADGAYYYSRSIGNSSDVFLEVLVKGYMNLFKFGSIYFVEKGDSVFFELSDEREVMMPEGRQAPQPKPRNYVRMLTLLMSDCPDAGKEAAKTPLKDKALVRLVAAYNRCKGSANQFFRVKSRKQ